MAVSILMHGAHGVGYPPDLDDPLTTHAKGVCSAYTHDEADIGVGCIGALIIDAAVNIVAGMSASAPIERRKSEWVENLLYAARQISEGLGYRGT